MKDKFLIFLYLEKGNFCKAGTIIKNQSKLWLKSKKKPNEVVIYVNFIYICTMRKEREISAYAALCGRIQEQINETRDRISSVKMHLYVTDHNLDQAILRWKYEYLIKQEQWLIELMCGKIEEEKQEEKQ